MDLLELSGTNYKMLADALEESNESLQEDNARLRNTNRILRKVVRVLRATVQGNQDQADKLMVMLDAETQKTAEADEFILAGEAEVPESLIDLDALSELRENSSY